MNCVLCSNTHISILENTLDKEYYICNNCGIIFTSTKYHLNKKEEESRYKFHQNTIENIGYIKFLEQIISPCFKYINTNMIGLDFGCGPNPVLSQLLEKKGIKCEFYDPYFFNNLNFENKYDFIFATECFEHFFLPKKELKLISNILKPNGILAIMTEFYTNIDFFSNWYYIKDPTHICFYNRESFDFICQSWKYKILYTDNKRVIILKKHSIN